jgi:hypothetical protein
LSEGVGERLRVEAVVPLTGVSSGKTVWDRIELRVGEGECVRVGVGVPLTVSLGELLLVANGLSLELIVGD